MPDLRTIYCLPRWYVVGYYYIAETICERTFLIRI